jgi:hypothetical protein
VRLFTKLSTAIIISGIVAAISGFMKGMEIEKASVMDETSV